MSTVACPLVFSRENHVYLVNGVVVPSVTQVLRQAGYVDFYHDLTQKIAEGKLGAADGVYALIQRGQRLLAARERGQRVHQALHFLIEDDLEDDSIDDEVRGYLASGRKYLDTYVMRVYRAEMRVWSMRHGYAGTLDLLAVHADGRLFIGDFKSGEPDIVACDLQTAAYLAAALEMGATDHELGDELRSTGAVIHRRSIRLFRDGRIAREGLYTDPRDYGRFLNALSLVHDQGRRPAPIHGWDDER